MAYQSYLTIKGTKQGEIKGGTSKGNAGDKWIEVVSVHFGAQSPIASSPQGGSGAGKDKNNPIVIVKEQDSASPLFFRACCSNEVLKEVVIERRFNGHTLTKVTLQDATVSKFGPADILPHKPTKGTHYDKIEFTFRQIAYTNVLGSTTATDDWTAQT
jgi:type VI secretion system Hcp family effector